MAKHPKHRPEPTPAEVEARKENRREYERKRAQTPERKEYRRRLAQAHREKAKEIGLCKDCPNPAMPGQTHCPTCAEKKQVSRRQAEKRAT